MGRPLAGTRGFSLLELLIAAAVLAILAAVAVPAYRDYVDSAATGALVHGIASMAPFQEEVMLRAGAYASGTYNVAAGDSSLTTATGWQPTGDDGTAFVVDASAGTSYRVTATDAQGRTVCRILPARVPC